MSRYVPGDVVIFLPGISGSVLAKDGREVWGSSTGAMLRAITTGGDSIRSLALSRPDDPTLDDLGDGVVATGLMPDIHLVPGLVRIDGYGRLVENIRAAFDLVENRTFARFAYDWRRDNRVSARRLGELVERLVGAQRRTVPGAKAVLVGHSMGGIVSRYYLEVLGGWELVRTLVTFGTPYGGSPQSLGYLVNGFAQKIGPLSLDLSALLASFTSIYQLLPTYECVRDATGTERLLGDIVSQLPAGTVSAPRAADALAFHDEIAHAVRARPPEWSDRIYPIVGIEQDTTLGASLARGHFELVLGRRGDGTVPERSASPFEFGEARAAFFAAQRHGSLQNDDAALAQLRGLLRPRDGVAARVRAGPAASLALELPEVVASGEVLAATIRYDSAAGRPGLIATLSGADGTVLDRRDAQPVTTGTASVRFIAPPAGCYRVTVEGSGDAAVLPVAEVFAAVGAGA